MLVFHIKQLIVDWINQIVNSFADSSKLTGHVSRVNDQCFFNCVLNFFVVMFLRSIFLIAQAYYFLVKLCSGLFCRL